MKKFIIICIVGIIVAIVGSIAFREFTKREVTFTLKNSDYTVAVYTSDNAKVADLTDTQTLRLTRGDYFYNVIGDGYDGTSTSFTVTATTDSVTITTRYLQSFLPVKADQEKEAIVNILKKAYPSIGVITITNLSIDETGQWAYGKLTINNQLSDIYRFVMEQDGDSWKIAVKPTIAIQKTAEVKVPEEILNSLY